MRTFFPLTLFIVSLLTAGAWAQSGFDAITLYEGKIKRGSITVMSKDMIEIENSGVSSEVAVGNIKQVIFSGAPSMLISAQTSITSGQLEDAIAKLKKINRGNIQRKIVADEVDYYQAYCISKLALAGSGDKNSAVTAMRKFADNTGTYHYYEANEITGDLALGIGRADVASAYYAKVGKAPWPEYKVKAAVLEGNALLAQGKYKEAGARYQKAAAANLNTPLAMRQKSFASLGKAKCLAMLGQASKGIQLAEKIIGNNDSRDSELFSRAYNALGLCHHKADNKMDALLAYVHVDLMFYQDPSQHAEALYHLIPLWKSANRADQSLLARKLLKERYPGSIWAGKAN